MPRPREDLDRLKPHLRTLLDRFVLPDETTLATDPEQHEAELKSKGRFLDEPNRVGSPATDERFAFLFPWTHPALQPIWTPDENQVGFSSGPRSQPDESRFARRRSSPCVPGRAARFSRPSSEDGEYWVFPSGLIRNRGFRLDCTGHSNSRQERLQRHSGRRIPIL